MNTLTSIEAERVLQVVHQTIEKLRVISLVPIASNAGVVNTLLTEKVQECMRRQWYLEEQLRKVSATPTNVSSETGGVVDMALTNQLRNNTRVLCRLLKADGEAMRCLNTAAVSTSLQARPTTLLLKYLNDLRVNVQRKLSVTVEDEAASRNLLHDVTEKERAAEESRDALQHQLQKVRDEKEGVVFGMDQVIRKLKLELQEFVQTNSIEVDVIAKEMDSVISRATAEHDIKVRQLENRIDALDRSLQEASEMHQDEETQLRKAKSRAENAMSSQIREYDRSMQEHSQRSTELKSNLQLEREQYRVLKEHFDKIDSNVVRSQEEDHRLNVLRFREHKAQSILHDAAATIQKIVRGRLKRLEYSKLKVKKTKRKKRKEEKKARR